MIVSYQCHLSIKQVMRYLNIVKVKFEQKPLQINLLQKRINRVGALTIMSIFGSNILLILRNEILYKSVYRSHFFPPNVVPKSGCDLYMLLDFLKMPLNRKKMIRKANISDILFMVM